MSHSTTYLVAIAIIVLGAQTPKPVGWLALLLAVAALVYRG